MTQSDAQATPEKKRNWFNVFHEIHNNVRNNSRVPVHSILEVDCLKGLKYSQTFASALPEGWERFTISAFGASSCFIGSTSKQLQLIHEFNNKYITDDWVNRYKSLEAHRRFCNTMLLMSISSSPFHDKMEVPSSMCPFIH